MAGIGVMKYPFRSSKNSKDEDGIKDLHKYSVYMQSRDSKWLNRNIQANKHAEPSSEPIEEDIRD